MIERLTHASAWTVSGIAALWGGALVLALQLRHVPIDVSHNICGPWGCGPPLPTLLACHGFWLVFLALPTGLCCRWLSPRRLHAVGAMVLVAGIASLTGVGLWEYAQWFREVTAAQREYFFHRWAFSVAVLVDVPILQLVVVGSVCHTAAWRRGRYARPQDAKPRFRIVGSSQESGPTGQHVV